MAKENFEFQAETKELLDLMVHSIYTNHEIFLRELISNASDALDKLHFASLTNENLRGNDLEIFLVLDKDNHTLTISDNGIGMTREELIDDIGTIAKSGTKAFLENLKSEKDQTISEKELIGRFGVGFYSSFMVAKRVVVQTKKAGATSATRWESDGTGTFTLEPCEKETNGTTITLFLSPEFYGDTSEENFLDQYKISMLVKKYSDYVRYPIKMNMETEEYPKDADGKYIPDGKPQKMITLKTLNSMQPLWTKNKNEIKPEEYDEFYMNQFHEWGKPLEVFHTKAEGSVEYTALMFIPAHAPFNLYYADYEAGLQLYSRHVFIMDKCKDLLPDFLGFMKGLVDSPDLPLNISRELLQQSRELKMIGKNLEKTILKTLERMLKNNREKYETFWKEFGKSFKIGVYNSFYSGAETKDKLKNLLLFASSNGEKNFTSLQEYVDRMKSDQKKIFYATGKDKAHIDELPQMELLKEKGIEVLYLVDRVDEFCIEALHEFDGKEFQSISRGDLGLDESAEEKKKVETMAKDNDQLLKDVKEILGEKVADVKLSNRLKSSAVCLVADAQGPSLAMEQAFAEMEATQSNNPMFKAKRILEINPNHQLFAKLKNLYEANGKEANEFKTYCDLLYTQALLIEGILPDDCVVFANRLADLMAK